MFKANKKVGETPLQMLDRLRIEKPNIAGEKLSYAGRLDPMAEGEMLILVGEENKNYNSHLNYDKEYEATFLLGVSTDTGDILGLIKDVNFEIYKNEINFEKQIESIKKIKQQIYPWFSGRKVRGKKLFDYYKEGRTDIERPSLDVEIKDCKILNISFEDKDEIKEYIFDSITKLKGDFRQEKILEGWDSCLKVAPKKLKILKIKITVSSGTFIRSLNDNLVFPSCLLNLKRNKILVDII
jgi:tRNA pseudouridine(55) synthase